jgi:hypothetical protein
LPRLSQGIAALHAQRLHDLQAASQWAEVFKLAQGAHTLTPNEDSLLRHSLVAANRLAKAAVEAGDWSAAIGRWQTMRDFWKHPDSAAPAAAPQLAIAQRRLNNEPVASFRRAQDSAQTSRRRSPRRWPLADEQRAWCAAASWTTISARADQSGRRITSRLSSPR